MKIINTIGKFINISFGHKRLIRQGIMTVSAYHIEELKEYSQQAYNQIAILMKQLSDRCEFTEKKL